SVAKTLDIRNTSSNALTLCFCCSTIHSLTDRIHCGPRAIVVRDACGHSNRLRAGQPLFARLGNALQVTFEWSASRVQDEALGQPADDVASGNRHAVARADVHLLVEITPQHILNHVPGGIGAEERSDVVGFKNLESLFQKL